MLYVLNMFSPHEWSYLKLFYLCGYFGHGPSSIFLQFHDGSSGEEGLWLVTRFISIEDRIDVRKVPLS